ncbi:MAG: hypothetical protein NTV59_08060 [Chloroflexi bacterium]|nr:hypothetical protein [Chloroflexota bacterium]
MRKELWKSLREWWIAVPQRWWDVLNVILAALPLIVGIAGVIWKRDTTEPLPIWIIATLVGGALLFIIVSFWAFHRVRMERDKLRGDESTENIKLMEWRKEYRQMQIPEVTQIPPTLGKMWTLVETILEEKKKKKCTDEKLLGVIADMLEIDRNDPILNPNNYTNEQKIRKSWRRIGARFGVKRGKERPQFLVRWRRLLPEVPDKHGIGLMLKRSSEYIALEAQLKDMSAPISKTVIYQNIDKFLEDLPALYNLKLLLFYSKATKRIDRFPHEFREPLRHLEVNIEKQMRTELVRIKANLEDYSIGKEPKDG